MHQHHEIVHKIVGNFQQKKKPKTNNLTLLQDKCLKGHSGCNGTANAHLSGMLHGSYHKTVQSVWRQPNCWINSLGSKQMKSTLSVENYLQLWPLRTLVWHSLADIIHPISLQGPRGVKPCPSKQGASWLGGGWTSTVESISIFPKLIVTNVCHQCWQTWYSHTQEVECAEVQLC